MKRFLSRLALLGIVAAGALGASVAASSAQACAPGSTDCSMGEGERPHWLVDPGRIDSGRVRPDVRPDVRPGRPDRRPDVRPGRPEWRPDARPGGRTEWRPDRDHRPRYDRHRPRRDNPRWRDRDYYRYDRPRGGIYLNYNVDRYAPGYYDDDYYYVEPAPRYVEPRYRVRLSAAHVEWCYARYKTYRASDNTFKPTRNTRRQCISPYS